MTKTGTIQDSPSGEILTGIFCNQKAHYEYILKKDSLIGDISCFQSRVYLVEYQPVRIYRSRKDEVRPEVLKAAVLHTATKRDSLQEMQDYVQILKDIREEPALYLLRDNYVADNKYIGTLGFNEVLDTVDAVAKLLNE